MQPSHQTTVSQHSLSQLLSSVTQGKMAASRPLLGMSEMITQPVYRGITYLRNKLGNFTWGPGLSVAKPAIQSLFCAIEIGTLVIVDQAAGRTFVYGRGLSPGGHDDKSKTGNHSASMTNGANGARKPTATPHAKLVVKSDSFWVRLFLFADMGFAEAYMLGEVECADLTTFFRLFILNRDRLGNGITWSSMIANTISGLARSTNTMSNALLNISAHYDISNDMFAAFLSPDMTYSCPIWRSEPAGWTDETLEEAQMTKLQRFIDGARIKSTDHVLEIGTGWGSFAIQAVRKTGCRVTSLTLSKEQKALADKRIAEAGFSDRIQVLLMDYRALPVPETPYDKIVSIEMLEAVGREFLGTYFGCIDRLLKRDGGIAVFQCITMPEGRHAAYSRGEE